MTLIAETTKAAAVAALHLPHFRINTPKIKSVITVNSQTGKIAEKNMLEKL